MSMIAKFSKDTMSLEGFKLWDQTEFWIIDGEAANVNQIASAY